METESKQKIKIELTENGYEAFVRLDQIDETFSCTVRELEEVLLEQGISYGINFQSLSDISSNPFKYNNRKITVAQGKMPEKGADGYIVYTYKSQQEDADRNTDASNKVDLRQIRKLDNVIKGQLLAEKVEPTAGKPGMNIKGELAEPPIGKEARFKIGRNVVLNPEKTKLYAAIDGMVSLTEKNKINVFPIYEVNGDVDYKIGNIDFNGTVIVRGNVLTGFTVKASGDIRVLGTIDGATVNAEGSVNVSEGIVGHHKGKVSAGKNINSSFVTDAFLSAGDTVTVSQSIMHSNVNAGYSVVCQGGNGLVVGGQIQAGEKLIARTIGNAASTATIIEVGIRPELRQEHAELHNQLQEFRDNQDKTLKALHILSQLEEAAPLSPEKAAMKLKLETTKQHMATLIADSEYRQKEIEAELQKSSQATIEVAGAIYPGTKLVMGKYVKYIRDSVRRVRFVIAEGEIRMVSDL